MPPMRLWAPIFEELLSSQSRMQLISMLPHSLQARLPPLRAIRKSVSLQTLTSSSRQTHTRSLSGLDGAPPNISQARIISESTEEHMSLVATEHHQSSRTYEVNTRPERHDQQPQQQQHQQQQQQYQQQYQYEQWAQNQESPGAEIHWQYAQQGMNLFRASQDEARSSQAKFRRKAFLDGVEYILRALPNDLNEGELSRLRSSVPPNFIPEPTPGGRAHSPLRGANGGRSILHRGVQSAVVNIFILIHLALPYIILLLRFAARTEREYRISENIVGAGMSFANTVGSQGMRITGALCNVGDGKVGQALTEAIAWTVEGFTGGLSDGVGEGLTIVGARRQ
ncbi:hypothetical protein CkaCkLH20_00963 [Colletotrichum karsti]|uniref:Uncharacterized protein n=1 Tax=Colletotrichum karsti TaxID=1095194 RepID=A0A9P6IEB3_9PEZI|nr:uncharacterized protein CkaCkLH20_00963 [Colletotrichum karsti]KAF9881817.1 hypothetical protein CkaCkLH20_00963 [Colletotrichum karsti]